MCNGTKVIWRAVRANDQSTMTCPQCKGTGEGDPSEWPYIVNRLKAEKLDLLIDLKKYRDWFEQERQAVEMFRKMLEAKT